MLSRAWPIYPGYGKGAVELIGTFTYSGNNTGIFPDAPHIAYFKGTSEILGYDNPGVVEHIYKAAN